MTNEQIKEEIASLEERREHLFKKIDKINETKLERALTEDELRKENKLRKSLAAVNAKIAEYEDKLNSKELTFGKKLALTLGFVGLCGILGVAIGKPNCRKNCASEVQTSVSNSISATATPETHSVIVTTATPAPTVVPTTKEPTAKPTTVPTAVPAATPTPTPADTLVDVTDDENVQRAARRIYNSDVKPMMDELNNPALDDFFTVEAIEDIIRMVNAELPTFAKYDDYTIAYTANLMNDIFANQGNHNVLYPIGFAKLYPEGSAEAKYIQTYDDIYEKIAVYRAEGNADGVVEQVGLLGSKIYNEWHLAGMYGGYNPYLFPAQKRYFLLQAATSRFSNYVREYLEANDLTVCIPTCYDVENGEHRLVEVRDIVEALYTGTSRNKAISIVDETGNVINVFAETFADAKAYFDAKAGVKVKGLN